MTTQLPAEVTAPAHPSGDPSANMDGDSITAVTTEKVVESVDNDVIEEAAQELAGETLGSHGTFFGTMPSLSSGNVGMSPADSARYAQATRQAIRDLYPQLIPASGAQRADGGAPIGARTKKRVRSRKTAEAVTATLRRRRRTV